MSPKMPAAAPLESAKAAEPTTLAPATDLETFLPAAAVPVAVEADAAPPVFVGVRSARLIGHYGRVATVQIRGEEEVREVALDSEVDASVVADALETGERVLVEADADGELVVVGVLRSRQPEKLVLRATTIEIDAEQELLLRSGKGALRIREDGDVELIGSRISAASRGLFRLVGRMLRLN